MQIEKKKILWLCRDKLLQQVEVPFLRDAGFEVFVPAEQTECASVSSHCVLSENDSKVLNNFDFWKYYFSSEVIEIVNRNFDVVMGELNQYISDSLVSFFPGLIFIREMGYGNDFGSPPKIEEMYPPSSSFWASFYENRSRINLIASVEILPQYIRDVFAERSIWIPLSFPFDYGLQMEKKAPESNVLLFYCPEIVSNPNSKDKFNKIRSLIGDMPYCVIGKQSIDINEYLGNIKSADIDSTSFREGAVFFDSSQDPSVIERSNIEALMNNIPVIYMQGSYLATLDNAKKQPGYCSSFKEAKKKITKLVNGDMHFRDYILDTQEVFKENFHIDLVKYYYYNLLFPLIATSLETISTRPKRVGLIMQHPFIGGVLESFKQLIRMFLRLEVDISIGINEDYQTLPSAIDKDDVLEQIRKITPSSVTIKFFHHQIFDSEYRTVCNALLKTERRQQPDILLNDGINYFSECDEYVFISRRTHSDIRLTAKPYSIIIYDCMEKYCSKSGIPENIEKRYSHFVKTAKKILVNCQATKYDVVSNTGCSKDKVELLPFNLSFEGIEKYLAEPPHCHNDIYSFEDKTEQHAAKSPIECNYILVPCYFLEYGDYLSIAKAFVAFSEKYFDSNKYLLFSGIFTSHLNPENDDAFEYPNIKEFKMFLRKKPEMMKRIYFAGEMPRHSFLSTIKKADAVLLPTADIDSEYAAMEAACLKVPSIAAGFPPMKEFAEHINLAPVWYKPGKAESIMKALEFLFENMEMLKKNLPDIELMKKTDSVKLKEKFRFAMQGVID